MGQVIRRTAAADDIFRDVRATFTNAQAKGGVFKTVADERLAAIIGLIDTVTARQAQSAAAVAPLVAAVHAKNDEADQLLGRISDEIWNEVGRPASDPALSTLFPGGIAYYADGSIDDQPDRMDLLAELLEAGIHPKLSADKAKGFAQEVRDSAAALRTAIDAERLPLARARLLDRVVNAVARSAQVELANVKRRLKAEHLSEAEIHAVIPDRPAPTPAAASAKKPPAPVPAPAGAG